MSQQDSYVPVSSGNKIRNIETVNVNPSTGVQDVVETQVVLPVGPDGKPDVADAHHGELILIREALEDIRDLLAEIAANDLRQAASKRGILRSTLHKRTA